MADTVERQQHKESPRAVFSDMMKRFLTLVVIPGNPDEFKADHLYAARNIRR